MAFLARHPKTYNHGVQTGAGEGAISTVQVGSRGELGLEVGLGLDAAVREGRAVVEAGIGGISRSRKSD